jgi:DNA-binding NtrC family response regulator
MKSQIDVLELVLSRTRDAGKARGLVTPADGARGIAGEERVRDFVRFLQLLVDDAQSPDGGRTGLAFESARLELDACDRQAACQALVSLLQHATSAAATPDCWLMGEAPACEPRTAWRLLDDLRDEQPWLPGPEAAQQGPSHLARQLLEALERSASDPSVPLLWRARWSHATGALDEADALYRRLLASPADDGTRRREHVEADPSATSRRNVGAAECPRAGEASAGPVPLAEGSRLESASAWERRAAARDACALRLQRGAVREAVAWRERWRAAGADGLELVPSRHESRDEWSLLDGAIALAEGDWAAARGHLAAVDLSAAPQALAELARDLPEAAEALPGVQSPQRVAAVAMPLDFDRRTLGAAALVVYAQDGEGGVRGVLADAAVALRPALAEHAASREDHLARAASLEARMFASGRGVVEHAAPVDSGPLQQASAVRGERAASIEGALGRGAKAVALEPMLDESGDPVGWLHMEWEHHLVPPACVRRSLALRAYERLRACASSARAIGQHAGEVEGADQPRIHGSAPFCKPASLAPLPGAAASARRRDPEPRERIQLAHQRAVHVRAEFEACVDSLGLKLARRAWRAYLVEDGVGVEVHRGGALEAFGLAPAPGGDEAGTSPTGGKALARALQWRACAGFEEPDARASASPRAKSGVALPIELAGRVVGAIAIESLHARDFRDFDGHGAQALLAARAASLRLAAFRDDHRRRHGWAPGFDASRADMQGFATRLAEVARSRCVVAISGEHGVGKLVVARWVHHEGGAAGGPFVVHAAGACPLDWGRLLRAAQGGTLVVDQLETLGELEQQRFLQVLEGHHVEDGRPLRLGGARLLVCCLDGLAKLRADGRLRPDLAARLARYELSVPPLRRRRADIPVLFTAMLARFAEEEDCRVPEVAEEALAVLFRQEHPGNLRDLEALAQRLVVHERGGLVTAADLERIAHEHGWKLAPRISSRHPRREDIRDALWSTRMQSGRTNKTRAASWLGWDPDTLVARMADLGLPDEVEPAAAWPWVDGSSASCLPDQLEAQGESTS